ncbi:MAG: hypothetical protein ACREFB_05895 [Stellaceae bacterium]
MAVPLSVVPVASLVLVTLLVLLADLIIAVLIARLIRTRRKKIDTAVVTLDGAPIALRRRTERALRARRPGSVIEMQVGWRQAAEAHRRAQAAPER